MLPFLLAPRRFLLHPFVNWDVARLRKKRQYWLKLLDYLVFVPFLLVASLPLWIYMDGYHQIELGLLFMLTHALTALIGFHTLITAHHALAKERASGAWELLILTKLDARQLILGKWWGILRQIWGYHVLTAVARLGMSVGYTQVLYSHFSFTYEYNCPLGWKPFCYCTTWIDASLRMETVFIDHAPISPAKAGFVCLILLGLGLLEAGLLTMIGLACSLFTHEKTLQIGAGLALRGIVFGVAILGLGLAQFPYKVANPLRGQPYSSGTCEYPYPTGDHYNPIYDNYYYMAGSYNLQDCAEWATVMRNVGAGLSILGDSGTLLGANIMRPFGSRLWILNQLLDLLLGIMVMVGFIWLYLKLAVWLAIRQGATRPSAI